MNKSFWSGTRDNSQSKDATDELAWRITSCGQLSLLIEASSPKPGNVSRTSHFSDTEYRHYLASAAQAGHGIFRAAKLGISISKGNQRYSNAKLGKLLYLSEKESLSGFTQRNTIFGSILLLIPLTVAISATIFEEGKMKSKLVQKHLQNLISESTVQDAIAFSHAFEMIDLGNHENKRNRDWKEIHHRYDMTNPEVKETIRKDELTLHQLFEISAPVDPLCKEIVEGYPLIMQQLYPRLSKMAKQMETIEEAVVRAFIWLLSEKLDGHILRKHGLRVAEQVRDTAKKTLSKYDIMGRVDEARNYLEKHIPNDINPGATADFMTAAVMCWLVDRNFRATL